MVVQKSVILFTICLSNNTSFEFFKSFCVSFKYFTLVEYLLAKSSRTSLPTSVFKSTKLLYTESLSLLSLSINSKSLLILSFNLCVFLQ